MSTRPQVGIERLPARRMSNEPRESMNCKSCRKRKIKCNRLRPNCEACQVFQCPCIYDAVPKKRGPKTDVLEALLKRVDGLEKRLKDEKSKSPNGEAALDKDGPDVEGKPQRPQLDTTNISSESAIYSPTPTSIPSPPAVQSDVLLDTYFSRCHGKVYYILDETTTRQRIHLNQIPPFLLHAIYAVAARYAAHPNGYHAAVRLSEDYAMRSRSELDIDEPSVECLQALLLLTIAFTAAGKGKKAYMMLSTAIGQLLALELHREPPPSKMPSNPRPLNPLETETNRRLFWTTFLMDRLLSTGSKRPSLIPDNSIILRLPSWTPHHRNLNQNQNTTSSANNTLPIEGEFFNPTSNLQYHSPSGKKSCQGSTGMLIDIVRLLGQTNTYLSAGGVKGDSHFPWHSLSTLSKIRSDLDIWASGTSEIFSSKSIEALFGQQDSSTLVLSKLIYHLIHVLIYRPFLPIDLVELSGTGQHQSWQIEATNLCFLHANAIAELVELGKQSSTIEWPAFVGYCICTAGTVHVHGTHYKSTHENEIFSSSSSFLSQEMQQLSELRYAWASVQHQRETLQTIYACHTEVIKNLANNPMRYSPVFHLEDFFDRYMELGMRLDSAHISFMECAAENESGWKGHDIYTSQQVQNGSRCLTTNGTGQSPIFGSKRKIGGNPAARRKHLDLKLQRQNSHPENTLISPGTPLMREDVGMDVRDGNVKYMTGMTQAPFSPPYPSFSSGVGMPNGGAGTSNPNGDSNGYDPMFSMPSNGQMYDGLTPSGDSEETENGTAVNGGEKDPFLSLLEQLAENECVRGGPSELDFFLGGGNG